MALGEKTTFTDVDGVRVLTAPTELDIYTAPAFREAHVEAVSAGHYRQVVDLSNTAYIDSTGLGVLVGARRRTLTFEGWVRLAGPNRAVMKCLRLTGLTKVFVIADTVEAAINYQPEGITTP